MQTYSSTTEEMGIKLAYEYDGYSVFARQDDTDLLTKVDFVVKYIQWLSGSKWGVSPVLKTTYLETQ